MKKYSSNIEIMFLIFGIIFFIGIIIFLFTGFTKVMYGKYVGDLVNKLFEFSNAVKLQNKNVIEKEIYLDKESLEAFYITKNVLYLPFDVDCTGEAPYFVIKLKKTSWKNIPEKMKEKFRKNALCISIGDEERVKIDKSCEHIEIGKTYKLVSILETTGDKKLECMEV